METVNKEEGDCEVKFLHPQFPACSYYWPCNDDKCCIPLGKVLSQVSLNTPTGRHYMVENAENLKKRFYNV